MRFEALLVSSLVTLSALAACGNDEGEGPTPVPPGPSTTGAGGSSSGAGGAGGEGGSQATCETPFTPAGEDAFVFMGQFGYLAQSTTMGSPVDTLQFEILDGAPAVGAVEITDGQYATCQVCVILSTGCDESLGNCEKTFLADAGTLDVTSSGATFEGTLTDVSFVEVTIDASNTSTPVAGAAPLCWDSFAFSAPVQGN